MTKPLKIVFGLVGSLLVLIIVVLIVAGIFIDSIARKGVEVGATYALGVPTTLDKASVGIISTQFTMNGLKVQNPKGWDGKFLDLGQGTVAVSLGSLASDTVVVPKFALSDVEVDLERNSSGANYNVILDNLKKLDKGDNPKDSNASQKKFKINEITITNVTVHLDMLGASGGMTKVNVPIAQIRLTNVGSDGSGVDIPKLTSIVLEGILKAAVEKGGGLIPSDISGELQAGLGQLSGLGGVGLEAVGKAGEQATKIGKDLGKDAKGLEDQVKKGLGGLLGGSDKKPDK